MMRVINVHEAKSTLSKLLEAVASGERIVIARAGKPVADLVPHARVEVAFGVADGLIVFDPETFDDPDHKLVALFEQD